MQARARHTAQVRFVVGKSRAPSAHGERRSHHEWIAELRCGGYTFVQRVRDVAARRLTTTSFDDALEQVPVLAQLDGLETGADQRAAVLLEDASLVQEDGRIERRLAAEGCQ